METCNQKCNHNISAASQGLTDANLSSLSTGLCFVVCYFSSRANCKQAHFRGVLSKGIVLALYFKRARVISLEANILFMI